MSDPTPIKPLDWHGFLRILAAHSPSKPLSANTIHADAGYIRLVGAENAAREESKGHLIRTWKRTSTAIPAHVCEVSAA